MLDAKHNRLLYDALLKAPEDYEFNHAIATTYSLDLESILLLPVALFFAQDMDFEAHQTRDDLLEALTKASKQISIFCQRGKIKVPKRYSNLIAFWEKGIHQVKMDRYYKSFHPKIWIIRYTRKEGKADPFYKFICTSRNLTFSRDWDLAICTEGYVKKAISGENESLIDMLKWLDSHKLDIIPRSFFAELPKVQFSVPRGFNTINFHPIGISDKYFNPVVNQKNIQDQRLVMSPFLQDETLKVLKDQSKKLFLFSTAGELSQIDRDILSEINPVFQFSPFIETAEKEESISEPDELPLNQSLHAKFFIDRKGRNISWFIGSANATQPASRGNIEFLVELQTTNSSYSPENIGNQLTSVEKSGVSLFQAYEGSYSELDKTIEIREQELRRLIHDLSSIEIFGEAILNEKGLFDLIIHLPIVGIRIPQDIAIRLKPLPEHNKGAIPIDFNQKQTIDYFKDYEEINLSPFLVFEIWEKGHRSAQFVVDMKIKLDDRRLDKIFTAIISNKTKFLNYLFFLMSEETPDFHSDEDINSKIPGDNRGVKMPHFANSPVYEKLLYTASRNPKKLIAINDFVERLKGEIDNNGNEVVSAEFQKMWQVFKSYSQKK